MPTVLLPLGSASASGTFAGMVVYQGTNVRKYVVPADPRTVLQLEVRKMFHDVTKILRSLGLKGKGRLAAIQGPRWYTLAYGRIAENGGQRLLEQSEIFQQFTEGEKAAWAEACPYLATYSEPGELYFCIARILDEWVGQITGGTFIVFPMGSNSGAYRVSWDEDLTDVITLSKTDDSDARFNYVPEWNYIEDIDAFGGGYHWTSTPNARCFLYFWGNQLNLGYVGGPDGGTLQIIADTGEVLQVNQYRDGVEYNQRARMNFQNKGIHWVELGFYGSSSQVVTVDWVDSANVRRTTSVVKEEFEVVLDSLVHRHRLAAPSKPKAGKTSLYVLENGKLYLLNSAGVSVEIVPEGITAAQVELLYSPLGHTHKQKILLGAAGEDGVIAAGGTSTLKPFRSGLAAAGFNVAIPIAGRLKNLYFRTGGAQPGSGSMTCTLNVNNTLRSVVATCPAGSAAGTFSDTVNDFEIAAGDAVWFTLKNNAGANSAPVVSALIELEFDSGAG